MDRRNFISILTKSAFGLFLPPLGAKEGNLVILPLESAAYQPLDRKSIPCEYLECVKSALEENYGLSIDIADPIPLPDEAYYKPRNRYRAPVIIENLKNYSGDERIIGLTPVDISQPEEHIDDWGVFGVAELGGRCSVISYYRLGSGNEILRRLEKVSVHEYGHLLGFSHCSEEKCMMSDIRGSRKNLDKMEYGYFCKEHDISSHIPKLDIYDKRKFLAVQE